MTNESDKFLKLIQILKDLRAPDGCDWDKEQTHESLVPYLVEETYEVIEAIGNKDSKALKEELGDLILHVLFQAELSSEKGGFDIMIANPPYVGHKGGSKAIFNYLKKSQLGKRFNNERMDLFYYFFHLILIPTLFLIAFIGIISLIWSSICFLIKDLSNLERRNNIKSNNKRSPITNKE